MQRANWDGWTDWLPLVHSIPQAPATPGAYMIAARRALNRAVGRDVEGILGIGESDNLNRRLRDFLGCARGTKAAGHMAGYRYNLFGYSRVFPLESLWICWCGVGNKDEAYALEGKMLSEYLAQHYELPPLNYKFNWSEHAAEESMAERSQEA